MSRLACFSATDRPWIVAEMSGNHNGSLERALQIIAMAADAGADAVKLQTYTADTITLKHDGPGFTIDHGPWAGYTLHDLYHEAHTPFEWHEVLYAKGREVGITVFSAPFDPTAVDLLESVGNPIYKIASFELVDLPLIARVARTGKPLILSTGLANLAEVAEAVATARAHGCTQLGVLQCVSSYPAPAKDSNLRNISHLRDAFGIVPGLSDHTEGTAVAVAAVALGARIIEKHVTLSRADGGVDAAFSLEPHELKALVRDTRMAYDALGEVNFNRQGSEAGNQQFRRSLYIAQDIKAGDPFTEANLRSVRPGFGLPPKYLPLLLGQSAACDIVAGTPMDWPLVRFAALHASEVRAGIVT